MVDRRKVRERRRVTHPHRKILKLRSSGRAAGYNFQLPPDRESVPTLYGLVENVPCVNCNESGRQSDSHCDPEIHIINFTRRV